MFPFVETTIKFTVVTFRGRKSKKISLELSELPAKAIKVRATGKTNI